MPAGDGRLWADVRGEVEAEGKVLVLRRIHVVYHLKAAADARETVERVHAVHKDSCPVYRSIGSSVQTTTELVLEPA